MTKLSYCIAGVTVCCLFLLTPSAHYAERRLCNDRVSVRPSVCLSHLSTAAAVRGGCALSALLAEDIDQ